MDYSIIVPAYNEQVLLPATLRRLNDIRAALRPEFVGEIIVVDNNSTDRSAEIAKENGAVVVFESRNCIALARNRGAESARGKYLIFVDADTLPPESLVRTALRKMRDEHVCGGGTTIEFDGKLPWPMRFMSWGWHQFIKLFPSAAGSFVFCLRTAWHDTGGFDTNMYAAEEVKFSYALRRWGKKHDQRFVVLDIPVVTSDRKVGQFGSWKIMLTVLKIALFPPLAKKKSACSAWYERADDHPPSTPPAS